VVRRLVSAVRCYSADGWRTLSQFLETELGARDGGGSALAKGRTRTMMAGKQKLRNEYLIVRFNIELNFLAGQCPHSAIRSIKISSCSYSLC